MKWNECELGGHEYWTCVGRECCIYLEPRPSYCDRGNWIAKIECRGNLAIDMDAADGWPRYYFDFDRAKLEIEAWLIKRKQAVTVEQPA